MEYDSDVYLLSSKFINDYPSCSYPELMHKQGRPYACLLIDTHDGYFICVPFRSSISHKNAFMFVGTKRSKRARSGLDYSKAVLVANLDYVDTYINHINGSAPLHPREFARKYQFSTLSYFHDIMGI